MNKKILCITVLLVMLVFKFFADGCYTLSIWYLVKDELSVLPNEKISYNVKNGILTSLSKKKLLNNSYILDYEYEISVSGDEIKAHDTIKNKTITLIKINESNYQLITKTGKKIQITLFDDKVYIGDSIDITDRNESIFLNDRGIEFNFFVTVHDKNKISNSNLQDIVISYSEYGSQLSFTRDDRAYKSYNDPKSFTAQDQSRKYYEYVQIDKNRNTTDIAYIVSYDQITESQSNLTNYFLLRYIDIPDMNVLKMFYASISKNQTINSIFSFPRRNKTIRENNESLQIPDDGLLIHGGESLHQGTSPVSLYLNRNRGFPLETASGGTEIFHTR